MRRFTQGLLAVALIGTLVAVLVPRYAKGRTKRSPNSCVEVNLPALGAAKKRWAAARNASLDATPSADDLLPFLESGTWPVCPRGGTYEIGPVRQPPACSYKKEHAWDTSRPY